ncbi:MAG TPA: LysR family transcriptional regulator [Steroidobacteraceae bacterium]|jgi:DNA-binding transcriptional LysR family regulator|nr:LysR family transcriptional regulator [Steroidobacteraceae bacterium]
MANIEPGWDLYRSFLAVLRLGSLSAAGRSLGLTQPTIGRHIATLQESLGGRVLFTRSQAGLMATAAAHELRPHAEDMAAAAAAFVRMGSGNLEETAGVVRLAAADVVGVEVLPAILSEFRHHYPNTVIELSLSNQMADLLRRDADIAVRMARPRQKALLAKRAGTVALRFYAHRRYLERYGYPERLEDLAHHALIGYDRTLPVANLLKAMPLPVSRELFAFRCDNDLAHIAALRSGFGIGICQTGIARRDPNLLPLLIKQFKLDMEIWIVMHNDLKRVSRMRLMFEHLAISLAQFAAFSSL